MNIHYIIISIIIIISFILDYIINYFIQYNIKKTSDNLIFKKKEIINNNNKNNFINECSICYEKYNNNEIAIELYCNHQYHYNCLIEWFNNDINTRCPLCNLPVMTNNNNRINDLESIIII